MSDRVSTATTTRRTTVGAASERQCQQRSDRAGRVVGHPFRELARIGLHMKGIILAGGSATRLYPLTRTISKQLLPVYDKPTILLPAGYADAGGHPRDPYHQHAAGSADDPRICWATAARLGMRLGYREQPMPAGIAQAFLIGADFIGSSPVCLILGDNIFYGNDLIRLLEASSGSDRGCDDSSRITCTIPNGTGSWSSTARGGPSPWRRSRGRRVRTGR